MIRVLVVEDSKTVQQALVSILNSDPEITVVGTASDGAEAVRAAMNLRPDLITMDINMPEMDGFEATRAIMSVAPTPIVVVTSQLDPKDSATLFRVMEAGALMVLAKPAPPGHPDREETVAKLIRNIKLMSEIKVVRRIQRGGAETRIPPAPPIAEPIRPGLIAIGASAGGPPVLEEILSALPADLAVPILIVQHMAEGFTVNFVNWLNHSSRLPVHLAVHGARPLPGTVYVAPDGQHLGVGAGERIILSPTPPDNGLRPSVAHLFRSVAAVYGKRAVGVLLTGMGRDGAEELRLIRDGGGVTVAQDQQTSVVFGMPGEAIRLKAASYVLPPPAIVALLTKLAAPQGGGNG
ncbi:chemotaxis-specific protein-glutamate methyltransferase CheB [Geomonas sp. RF6]|uniref:chemotaxis-specific protein-glutamate methyltransferase CheB n=1 Tax=Geomonas sp. RF6 TaxID=2897342 RepID=UPI001E56454C|nr:chemotaxis-specific protein-glutamate methyltransferase CheB [Geomonas sp. RF6]UFS69604.1 chemotaxis-specific protein-glutamate methyltransferase CheB [Geomonas sp. RF6]